ncbi:MAG: hypothetical protein ACOYJB_05365 [Christensenellaceae bacterium]|jgi:hypothetical protein
MKKGLKLVAILTLGIALMVPTVGFAADGFEPPAPSYNTTNGADGKEVIPVYGYIGQDTAIVDPDPENPEVKPETEIYVEVPVKIMFAAFESDGGAISSPDYTLTNLSTATDVKVEIQDFVQENAAEANLEDKLALNLTDHAGSEIVAGIFPADYATPKLFADTLAKKSDGSSDNVLAFKVGGSWSGGFDSEIHPDFNMTLRFSAITADQS